MKKLFIFLLFVTVSMTGQTRFYGTYKDYFGSSLDIRKDGTFRYTHYFDLYGSFTHGTWSYVKDTLYFEMRPLYDTLQLMRNGSAYDTLVLSSNEYPERLSEYAILQRTTLNQNKTAHPQKLVLKRKRLYVAHQHKLSVKKKRGFWSNKKFPPWYYREKKNRK